MNEVVNLHIEQLVLSGIPEQEREGVGRAVQAELSRLLSERGIPEAWSNGRAIPSLDGGSFAILSSMSAEAKGRSIAGRIYSAHVAGGGREAAAISSSDKAVER